MRNVSEATKINKIVSKVLTVLDKEQLNEEEIASVLHAVEATLGIEPPKPPVLSSIPSDSANKED